MSLLLRLGMAFVLVAVIGLAQHSAPKTATLDFFSTAAEIIPVLMLVLAVEARLFLLPNFAHVLRLYKFLRSDRKAQATPEVENSFRTLIAASVMLVTLALLVGGEFSALAALETGKPSHGDPAVVYQALGAGFAAIVCIALFAERLPEGSDDGTRS